MRDFKTFFCFVLFAVSIFSKIGQNFAKIGQNFAKIGQNFAKIGQNFAKIGQNLAKKKQILCHVDHPPSIWDQQRDNMNSTTNIPVY